MTVRTWDAAALPLVSMTLECKTVACSDRRRTMLHGVKLAWLHFSEPWRRMGKSQFYVTSGEQGLGSACVTLAGKQPIVQRQQRRLAKGLSGLRAVIDCVHLGDLERGWRVRVRGLALGFLAGHRRVAVRERAWIAKIAFAHFALDCLEPLSYCA